MCPCFLIYAKPFKGKVCLRTFGINVYAHPYYACVFLTDSKTISAIVYFSHKLQ